MCPVEGVGSAMMVEDAATMVVGWDTVEGTLEAEVVAGEDFQVAEAMLDTRGLIISDQAVVEEAVLVDQPPPVYLPEIEQGHFHSASSFKLISYLVFRLVGIYTYMSIFFVVSATVTGCLS